jgi:hypothetical protein
MTARAAALGKLALLYIYNKKKNAIQQIEILNLNSIYKIQLSKNDKERHQQQQITGGKSSCCHGSTQSYKCLPAGNEIMYINISSSITRRSS